MVVIVDADSDADCDDGQGETDSRKASRSRGRETCLLLCMSRYRFLRQGDACSMLGGGKTQQYKPVS